MAIGRTFKEALQKAIRSLEIGRCGFADPPAEAGEDYREHLRKKLRRPNSKRLFQIGEALKLGMDVDEIHELTQIDPWFLHHVEQIVQMEAGHPGAGIFWIIRNTCGWPSPGGSPISVWRQLTGSDEENIRQLRMQARYSSRSTNWWTPAPPNLKPTRPTITRPTKRKTKRGRQTNRKWSSWEAGPNRIGQGIEFDYCCVHASFSLAEEEHESIMINSNPETVSTDYDTSDKLYFEPLTREDVLHILETEKPIGVHCPVWRSNPPQPGSPPGTGGGPDSRDFTRRHRSCRRPQAFPGTAAKAGAETAAQRHRVHRRGGLVGRGSHRLSCGGASLLCSGRPGHGNRLRRDHAQEVHGHGGACLAGSSHPHRPVSGGRRRIGCGCHQRRVA